MLGSKMENGINPFKCPKHSGVLEGRIFSSQSELLETFKLLCLAV